MRIEDEITQQLFKSEFIKADINLVYTAQWLNTIKTQTLKPYKLSWQQFNILRILKGMQSKPASIKLLTSRMIDKMSNASRLVSKLELKGYVQRVASPNDRRQVDIFITNNGLEILEKASNAVEGIISAKVQNITLAEAKTLNQILDKMRG